MLCNSVSPVLGACALPSAFANGAGSFVVLDHGAFVALFPVFFPARSEMPWNRWRTYDFGHFVAEARGYGFDMWGDDDSDDTGDDDSFPSFTFEHALFGPASGHAQFRQIAQSTSYARRRTPPASERRRTLLARPHWDGVEFVFFSPFFDVSGLFQIFYGV